MKKSVEQIFEDVAARGYIEEKEIRLLCRRSNEERRDVCDYSMMGEGLSISPEQAQKGLIWLYKEARKRNKRMGWREIEIVKNATKDDFSFMGLYDAGNRMCSCYTPVYKLGGMEYYYYGGEVQIVG